MVIIDAYWEKTNLGVDSCKEITFSSDDEVDTVQEQFSKTDAQYLVAKVPAARVDLLALCQNNGYKFIESNFAIKKNLRNLSLPKEYMRFQDKIIWKEPTASQSDRVFKTIKQGVFDSDKIALDKKFGLEKSAKRYYNWITSALNKDSKLFIVYVGDREIGFIVVKAIDADNCEGTFGALFPDCPNTGFGFALPYATFKYAKEAGFKFVHSGVSGNNPVSLRMNLFAGYEIEKVSYCLVKHRA